MIEPPRLPPETMRDLQLRFEREKVIFDRKLARQRRIAYWCLIPYTVGGALAGVGIANVGARPDMRVTLGMLLLGFVLLVTFQWVQPWLTVRANRSESISETAAPDVK